MARGGRVEFGDFQTPPALAAEVCAALARLGVAPATVVEPTCGSGNLLLAAMDRFPDAGCLGMEIDPDHVDKLADALRGRSDAARCAIRRASFFDVDWRARLDALKEPILVLGNPPWVTNARIGALGGSNLPPKSNFQGLAGLDALTGKSNFDISEWMLIRLLEALAGRRGWLAMLCKTAVARKAMAHAWKAGMTVDWAEIRRIDAPSHFGAAVDACLLVCAVSPTGGRADCRAYDDLSSVEPAGAIGWRDGRLVADVRAYERWRRLGGGGADPWRSGVKHDRSKGMELTREPGGYRNGFGELVDLEDEYVFPMLKSSDVANGRTAAPTRRMLVPQRFVGEETATIARRAPKTWAYLSRHGEALDRRGSSIYRGRPRFSVFGVGDYTFAPWKVAISGFYKRLDFQVVGSFDGKPIVPDDTVYFLPCRHEPDARRLAGLLNSDAARGFFSAFVFWDAKRPITAELLRRLDLGALADEPVAADRAVENLKNG